MSRRTWIAVALAALAFQGLLLWLELRPAPRAYWGDEITYVDAARAFLRGETPDLALWPDLYPRLLRFLLAEDGRPWLAIPLQIVLLAIAAWALMRFGEVAMGDRRVAALAAALLLIDPGVAAFTHYLWPEILHLTCLLGALALLAARARFDRACLAGALLALAILAKSLLVPFLLVVAVVFWRAHAGEFRVRTAIFGLGAGLLLVLLPWAIWQWRSTGEARLVKSAWFNVWVGLNDRSPRNLVGEIVGDEAGVYVASAATAAEREAIVRDKSLALVRARGLGRLFADQLGRQYFRLFDANSFFSDQLPGGAIADQGYGYRMSSRSGAAVLRAGNHLFFAGLLVAAVWGVLATPWRDRPWSWAIAAFLVYNLGLFLVLHVKSRYRVQFEPLLCLLAAQAWVRREELRQRIRRRPLVGAMGFAGCGLLLWLAFATTWRGPFPT